MPRERTIAEPKIICHADTVREYVTLCQTNPSYSVAVSEVVRPLRSSTKNGWARSASLQLELGINTDSLSSGNLFMVSRSCRYRRVPRYQIIENGGSCDMEDCNAGKVCGRQKRSCTWGAAIVPDTKALGVLSWNQCLASRWNTRMTRSTKS